MNAEVVLPLEKMSLDEKLEVLDLLWADIARKPEEFQSPAWHGEYLKEVEQGLKNGTERFLDIDEAEQMIMDLTS